MSLVVRILKLDIPKSQTSIIGWVEFRGVSHTTSEFDSSAQMVEINQTFIWPLARAISPEEMLTFELRSQTTKILHKTGFASTSNFRKDKSHCGSSGIISSSSKCIGRYMTLMKRLIIEQEIYVEDNLLHPTHNTPLEEKIIFEVKYMSPENYVGAFESNNLSGHIDNQLERNNMNSLEEEQKMLLNIKHNIENLEKNIKKNINSPQQSRRQVLSGIISGEKLATLDKTDKSASKDKKVSMKSVRNLIKFRKHRFVKRSRDSSTEDEGRSPLITESEQGITASATEFEDDDKLLITQSGSSSDVEKETKFDQFKLTKAITRGFDHLKSQDFQVCVTIIEARQLPGLNIDPVVCIQVGEQKKYTSVKESTNCPYFNEYFVFDFHMPPVMLFDKIIILSVLQSRSVLRPNKLIGTFKLDIATVWNQKDHQFNHKWALLSDPEDFISGPKGYLKCDIGIVGEGDTIKVPQKSEKDPDDIEGNLLLPDGVSTERQRAKFIIKIYRADGLPRMNSSLIANVKKAFTGESKDLVSPYVQVSFAGLTGKTSVKKNSYSPIWNEQLVFTEMFPPLCQRIKIQMRDAHTVKPSVIGTHYIDLKQISNDGENGFLPTFGPSFIHLYGSTRDYNILNHYSSLNTGLGEGVSYRARLLVAIRTEIPDNIEIIMEKNVELEPAIPINESSYAKNEEFFLFSTIFEASMIDKKCCDKAVHFELSIGNFGNSLDGHNESFTANDDEDGNLQTVNVMNFSSLTNACKPISYDKSHYYLSYWDYKPCMDVRCIFPDVSQRMFNTNIIAKIAEKLEKGLRESQILIDNENARADVKLRSTLEEFATSAMKYLTLTKIDNLGPGSGKTKLDKERIKLCQREIESLGNMARNLRALVTKNSMQERCNVAKSHLQKLKILIEDPQHALPDVFIWLIAANKRLAYHRIPARNLIFSPIEELKGVQCGKIQTLFLKLPGKKFSEAAGWSIQAKISTYIWLGHTKNKEFSFEGLPKGYELSQELRNADRPRALPPKNIHYIQKYNFQLRAYVYQARSLIASDASGLSDPYATVFITEFARTTQVIEETLNPTWDELLIFEEILIYGAKEEIKKEPPGIVIEIYDQDKMGKSEFIGRAIARPRVKLKENTYVNPNLEWFDILRGNVYAGELLASFQLLENGSEDLPTLTEPKPLLVEYKNNRLCQTTHLVYPIPKEVRPVLSWFRLEVLFWGLRDLKRIYFMPVDRPRIDVECSGRILSSVVIQNAKKVPNFSQMLKFIDLELPIEEIYAPPISIRCVDCRSFGRYTLVGTNQISSVHRYIFRTKSKEKSEDYKTVAGKIILRPIKSLENLAFNNFESQNQNITGKASCENLTIYGAVCVSKITKPEALKGNSMEQEKRIEPTDEDEHSKDWWTKYFWSYEKFIDDRKSNFSSKSGPNSIHKEDKLTHGFKNTKLATNLKPKKQRKESKPFKAFCQIYTKDLETQAEFNYFKDWLQTFTLYRGKKTGDSTEDESRTVGYFKGSIKVYKLPLPNDLVFLTPSLPSNDPIHVLVRVYIIKATDLHPMDLNGKADPYIVLHTGNKKISDKENYISKQLNPLFGKCFEIEATFPQDSLLTVQILDWDLVGSDDLIGETRIDLENRFYSKHRATCGLAYNYEQTGYNRWRDPLKPTQILSRLCKDNKIETPHYFQDHVIIGKFCMTFSDEDVLAWNGPSTSKNRDEHLALACLHRWEEIPRIGCKIVPEHIETRSLYNQDKPGIEQGKLEMWIDMFPMDMPLPGPPVDISPRKPKSYVLRVVIWNTDDVILEDDAFFTNEKIWLKGPQDIQSTDIHYRSLTGEGNFNWRFIFPFDYLAAEERIVLSRRESLFSWDETEVKIPARLELQVWDADHFSADDFLGAISLNLNRFTRGAKTSKLCTLDMLKTDNVPKVNIFKQKRIRGWWPFLIKRQNDEIEITGKVEAELHLLTKEEDEQNPAGYGRNEPDPLEKPNRPDASFMWFMNPIKSIRYIVWHSYKWTILKFLFIFGLAIMLLLFFYSVPGYTVKKMLGV